MHALMLCDLSWFGSPNSKLRECRTASHFKASNVENIRLQSHKIGHRNSKADILHYNYIFVNLHEKSVYYTLCSAIDTIVHKNVDQPVSQHISLHLLHRRKILLLTADRKFGDYFAIEVSCDGVMFRRKIRFNAKMNFRLIFECNNL